MTSSSPIPINIPSISKEDKGKGIMTEPAKPTKQKVQEQMSEQLARELEEEFAQENQRLREQVARDAEIARLHTEGELKMMIDELDRSNELSQERANISEKSSSNKRKYQAQQRHEFDQLSDFSIPVWESIQDFVPMDSKLESERFKRPGTLLEKERAKRLKTVEGSEQQSEGNKDVKEKGRVDDS
ncbi:hypothetical protein Tco_1054199 [Tanacetum coccineum]|uniref:Uncharacterized protein n=1 Tax=Tanacetum coccineum TaxID=301880 RepID=A0ABQ5GXY7_9ASTR